MYCLQKPCGRAVCIVVHSVALAGNPLPFACQVAIGRTMFVDHGMCRSFFELSGLMDDVAMEGHTRWGAEDIFLSLAIRALSGHKPYVLPLEPGDVKDLPDLAVGISRHKTHLQ